MSAVAKVLRWKSLLAAALAFATLVPITASAQMPFGQPLPSRGGTAQPAYQPSVMPRHYQNPGFAMMQPNARIEPRLEQRAPEPRYAEPRAPAGLATAFANPFDPASAPPRPRVYIPTPRAASNAYCVRTCDGRFFPHPTDGGERDVKACEAMCPATDMKIYSGVDIKSAVSSDGKPYIKLANAFRFQREMVGSCTCNARTGLGMTPISIKDDRTLRTGDIVAESKRLMEAEVISPPDALTRSGRRSGGIRFRPLSEARAKSLGLASASLR
jgi:hypothetical protein